MKPSGELSLLVRQLARAARMKDPGLPVPKAIDWDRWLRLVDENDLGPLLASRCAAREVPRAIAIELRDRYARSGQEAAFRCLETLRVVGALEGSAEPILLKGSALVHTLYAEAAERCMADVDLLLPSPEDVACAEEALARFGYKARSQPRDAATPAGHHHGPPLYSGVADLALELHTNLSTPPLPKRVLAWMWRRRVHLETPGTNVWVLDPSSALMHHAIHALSDPVDSPLLRNIFEVAWMATALSSADRSAVRSLAVRWGIESAIAPALAIAHDLFRSPPIVHRPSFSAGEALAKARLEWDDAYEERRAWSTVRRSFVRAHFAALKRRPRTKGDWLTLLSVAGKFVADVARGRFAALGRVFSSVKRVRVSDADAIASVGIGDRVLAHDRRSGSVHLLDRAAARALQAAHVEASPKRLEEQLVRQGVPKRLARSALVRLREKGLVRAVQ